MKKAITLILTLTMLLGLCAFSGTVYAADEITVTDMIGREVTVTPGSYQRVVCIGAGALRMYSYIGDVSLLCGVEDIDNTSLAERPKMFDSVARPYMLAYGESFKALPSWRRRSSPAIPISSSPSMRMWRRRTPCRSSSACPSSP